MSKHVNFRTSTSYVDTEGTNNAPNGSLIVTRDSDAGKLRIYQKGLFSDDTVEEIGTNPSSVTTGDVSATSVTSPSIKYTGEAEINTLYGSSLSISNSDGESETAVTLKSGSAADLNTASITKVKKAYQDEDGNNIKASYGASLSGTGTNTVSLLNKNDTQLNSVTVNNVDNATNADNIKSKLGSYETLANALLEMVYPVGSIYMSANNVSPANFLGGEWAAWGSGSVPVGVNASDPDFTPVNYGTSIETEKTGGSKTNSYSVPLKSHVHSYDKVNSPTGNVYLTTSQIPAHQHYYTPSGTVNRTGDLSCGFSIKATSNNDILLISNFSTDSATLYRTERAENPATVNPGNTKKAVQTATFHLNHSHGFAGTRRLTEEAGSGSAHSHTISTTTVDTGTRGDGSSPTITASTLQPYITCYMWKRTK